MNPWNEHLTPLFILALLGVGAWCLATRKRVIKQVIGLNIMLHGALLGIVDGGVRHKQMELAQSMIISALLVETIVLAVILALVINVYRYHPEGLVADLDTLKG
ncbi:MAG: NADH-quinone oxidoreductase subunit K [Chloroflexi bacterium]|nr:NADH-quinone oxidoreductase subunit K [Chloroflexota bacterium]